MSNNQPKFHPNRLLTQEEIEVRVWAFVVLIVTFILAGIVFFMLYSLAFVTQPLKSMAPLDQAMSKMLNDVVLLVVGGIGGVMSRKGTQAIADKLASTHQLHRLQLLLQLLTKLHLHHQVLCLSGSILH